MPAGLLLPLFPLEVVLFPGTLLPLHIFEERYKQMVGEALEQGSEFGIVLAKGRALVNVGCTAAVEKVVKRYDDGRLDILTGGRRRFEVLFLDNQKPYLQAAVHYIADEASEVPAEAEARLREWCEEAAEYGAAVETVRPGGKLDSFQIADALPADLDFKQRLLAQRSEAERVATLNEYLEKMVPRWKATRQVEVVSRGNGHARRGGPALSS